MLNNCCMLISQHKVAFVVREGKKERKWKVR